MKCDWKTKSPFYRFMLKFFFFLYRTAIIWTWNKANTSFLGIDMRLLFGVCGGIYHIRTSFSSNSTELFQVTNLNWYHIEPKVEKNLSQKFGCIDHLPSCFLPKLKIERYDAKIKADKQGIQKKFFFFLHFISINENTMANRRLIFPIT